MKKIPLRMCIACREHKPKSEMLRIVKNNEGDIFIDFSGKADGRGAYICNNDGCINNCVKRKALNKVFKADISNDIYASIKEEFFEKQ